MSEQFAINPEQNSASNALVIVSTRDNQHIGSTVATDAGFLAQLLACRAGIAAYRRHRREEPAIANGLYRASALRPAPRAVPGLQLTKVA